MEVIVPGACFLDAVQKLKDNPGLDVGVHLTLTSEWERCKWRPLTSKTVQEVIRERGIKLIIGSQESIVRNSAKIYEALIL